MTEPLPLPAPAVLEAYLAPTPAGGVSPGVTLQTPPYGPLALPLPGRCVLAGPRGGGYVSLYRLVLDAEINNHGLIVKAGAVLYLRVESQTPPNAQAGAAYPEGHPLLVPRPGGEVVSLALRLGNAAGIPAWDAGDPEATAESPARPGGGYPARPDHLRRAAALRFVDPGHFGFCAPRPRDRRRLL